MVLPRQSEDPAKPKKTRSTDDFGITGLTVYMIDSFELSEQFDTFVWLDWSDGSNLHMIERFEHDRSKNLTSLFEYAQKPKCFQTGCRSNKEHLLLYHYVFLWN